MKDGSQFLPGRLVVSLLVASFDGHYSICDDFPPLDKHFFIKVVAPVEGKTEVDLHIVQRDQRDGFAETLGGLGDPAGHGHGPGGVGLLLHGQDRQRSSAQTHVSQRENRKDPYGSTEVRPLGQGQGPAHLHSPV